MNFLAPLFLAGALAVGLPLVFHLIRRTTRERTLFSSLMFLKPTPPRLTKRSRLEHLLLLLLRCAAVCLLAAGFARPFVKYALPESSTAAPPKRLVILVDTSASMRRADLWSQARDKVTALLRDTVPADQVAVLAFDRQTRPLVTFEEWNAAGPSDRAALVSARLAESKPGWAATRLDQAVIRASELIAEAETGEVHGPRRIIVVSDMQAGSALTAMQGLEWPKGLEVTPEPVTTRTSNVGLQMLTEANETAAASDTVRMRVNNSADSAREQFQVGWAGNDGSFVEKATDIYVPAGQSRIVTLARPAAGAAANRVVVRGDQEDFDNTVFHVVPEAVRVPVVYFGSDGATNARAPLYFLVRAFQATPQQRVEILARPPSAVLEPKEAEAAALFIVTDALSEPVAAQLRGQVQQGRTVILAPTSAEAAGALGWLLGQDRVAAVETEPRNYAMLGDIDFRHPLFAPFADPRFSDFTKVHFWKYRRLDLSTMPGARAVAKFDNGDPAIVEFPAGRGRVVFFASGWSPADSQLALSTKFVPLVYSALEWSGAASGAVAQFNVGDVMPLTGEGTGAEGAATVTFPDGFSLKVAAGETNFTQAAMPGIYEVKTGTSQRRFAVNLDAAESRTAPLPLDELERLGVPTTTSAPGPEGAAATAQPARNAELENHQKLWRWFIIATLAVLFLETGIAGWTARKQTAKLEAAA